MIVRYYAGRPVVRKVDGETEKSCSRCQEWWPQTDEFYSFIHSRGHYHNECRACRAQQQANRRKQAA
ncbi:hypothetical protein K32_49110 [Kaistia sp. 32K]|nr:hypothetical protein K32_49110 [Kaistia sp. 32K]